MNFIYYRSGKKRVLFCSFCLQQLNSEWKKKKEKPAFHHSSVMNPNFGLNAFQNGWSFLKSSYKNYLENCLLCNCCLCEEAVRRSLTWSLSQDLFESLLLSFQSHCDYLLLPLQMNKLFQLFLEMFCCH